MSAETGYRLVSFAAARGDASNVARLAVVHAVASQRGWKSVLLVTEWQELLADHSLPQQIIPSSGDDCIGFPSREERIPHAALAAGWQALDRTVTSCDVVLHDTWVHRPLYGRARALQLRQYLIWQDDVSGDDPLRWIAEWAPALSTAIRPGHPGWEELRTSRIVYGVPDLGSWSATEGPVLSRPAGAAERLRSLTGGRRERASEPPSGRRAADTAAGRRVGRRGKPGFPGVNHFPGAHRALEIIEAELFHRTVPREEHLRQRAAFLGLQFWVTKDVIIPRAKTENTTLVAERAVREVSASRGRCRILEIGTGCGAIAISLAARNPAVRAVATDLSLDALNVAQANARRHGVERRVRMVCADLCRGLNTDVDVLVANLPYLGTNTRIPVTTQSEPALAVFDDIEHPWVFQLLAQVARAGWLPGMMIFEFDPDRIGDLAHEADRLLADRVETISVHRDAAGVERVMEVRCKTENSA